MPTSSSRQASCAATRYFRFGGNTGIIGRLPPAVPILLVIAIWVVTVPAWAGQLELQLAHTGSGTVLRRPVAVGDTFIIAFVHSYAKSLVEEVFEVIGPGEFHLRETLYADFGAGLPHEPGPGQRMEFVEGRMRISGYDMKFEVLELRVGRVADHTLLVSGEKIRLDSLFAPGSGVAVRVAEAEYPEQEHFEETR